MRRFIQFLCIAAICLFAAMPSSAQKKDKPKPGDEMIYKYLCAETDKLSKKVFDGAKSIDEWRRRRPRLHKEYLYMLGLDPLPKKTPLKVTFTGSFEHEGVIIDMLHYQSVPGLYVTANLYRPKGTVQQPQAGAKRKRHPAIVYVCGHAGRGRDGNKSAYQDHGIWFAKNGYICIVLDTLQLGEIPGVHHGTYGVPWRHARSWGETDKKKLNEGPRWWWHSRGYTPAGVECWNGIRAIDYLAGRPDVDAKRIGVTGISGGGAATFWIAAADDRVACAVPVSGMSDLESYVKNKVINGHCDCMFLYNTFQWEWTTIAGLIAPRPMMFANSDNDRIFPMDGNRRIAKRLRKIYKWYGKPDNFAEYVSEGGHAYRPDLRLAIFKFINKHLKNDTGPVQDVNYAKIPGEKLRAFPTDADIPKDVINHKIDETFVAAAKVVLPRKGEFAAWKKGLVKELREKCFRGLPKAVPAAKFWKRPIEFEPIGKTWEPAMKTEPGIEVSGFEVLAKGQIKCLYVEPDEELKPKPKLWKALTKGNNTWILYPRGIASTSIHWNRKSPPNYVERSHVLIGRQSDVGRVWDIVAAFKYLVDRENSAPAIVGEGTAGILAAYAALFEPSIKEVIIIDPPTSHKDGPNFLNVMRVLDIPEALGLLAPRVKLTLVNAKDRAFDRTAEIYRIAGAEKMFVRK